jgi:hypothetical protein
MKKILIVSLVILLFNGCTIRYDEVVVPVGELCFYLGGINE